LQDNDSYFHQSLGEWRELNISPTFLEFANKTEGLSASMALLVHHWQKLLEFWLDAVDKADEEALKPLLEYIYAFFISCDGAYPPPVSNAIEETWAAFAQVLPKCDPEVQRVVAELWGTTIRRLKAAVREQCVLSIVSAASPDVSSWVFVSACKQLADAEKEDSELLRRLLEVITVPCSVRQGSRMSAKHLTTLLSQFESLPLSDLLHEALLKFVAACLTAGDMALWMGPGRKVFVRIWERPVLALELCTVLSDLNWGGCKLLASPHVVKLVPDLLDSHTEKALELLSALQKEKKLQAEASWKQRLQAWFTRQLSSWSRTPDQVGP
ncbi:uncharacterized protein PHACADRAFT_99272, partial [Phanerochaete carnosa HHB-10118-sp]